MATRKTTTNRSATTKPSATAKPAPKDTATEVESAGVVVEPTSTDKVVAAEASADDIVASPLEVPEGADGRFDAHFAGDDQPLDEFLVQALWNEYRVELIRKYGRTYVDRFARIAEEAFIEGLRKGHDAG